MAGRGAKERLDSWRQPQLHERTRGVLARQVGPAHSRADIGGLEVHFIQVKGYYNVARFNEHPEGGYFAVHDRVTEMFADQREFFRPLCENRHQANDGAGLSLLVSRLECANR